MHTLVKSREGQLRGRFADGVYRFLGVPYAAPPFGANRLRPPQPAEPWSGVRDALTFGAEPPQLRPDPELQASVPDPAVPAEDCLNLNIWTRTLESAKLPVMVWIHGGMFEFGSGASYDGSRFARDGVVCVSINYRLGAEGFLFLGEGNANRGLLDQVAALRWVQENIVAFGGDPDNVTIFGESAGALSVGTLLAMPCAAGLFHRAILQSGASHCCMPAASGRRIAHGFAVRLSIEASRDAVARTPIQCLLAAQDELRADLFAHPDPERWSLEVVTTMLPWQPVVDGQVLPALPIDLIAAGASAGVDIIAGTNLDENRLFLTMGGAIDQVTPETLAGTAAAYGLPIESAISAYRDKYPGATPGDLLAKVQTDWYWRIPAIRLADEHAKCSSRTYMYEFAWRSPVADGRLGACHGLDIPFVFDTLDKGPDQMVGPLLGEHPPQTLADTMHRAWVAFAACGDPGWPQYDLNRRATMRFEADSHVVDDPRVWERALWEGVR